MNRQCAHMPGLLFDDARGGRTFAADVTVARVLLKKRSQSEPVKMAFWRSASQRMRTVWGLKEPQQVEANSFCFEHNSRYRT